MAPFDERDMVRLLGEIEGRLVGLADRDRRIEEMLIRWENQHESCRTGMDARLRVCEQTRAQAIAVGGIVGMLAGMSSWLRELWRG